MSSHLCKLKIQFWQLHLYTLKKISKVIDNVAVWLNSACSIHANSESLQVPYAIYKYSI